MLLPALLVNIDSTSGAVVNMGSSPFSANRTIHSLSPLRLFSYLTPLYYSNPYIRESSPLFDSPFKERGKNSF